MVCNLIEDNVHTFPRNTIHLLPTMKWTPILYNAYSRGTLAFQNVIHKLNKLRRLRKRE